MNESVLKGFTKACIMKEVLASCQIEGIGNDITLSDLYLEEIRKGKKNIKKQDEV